MVGERFRRYAFGMLALPLVVGSARRIAALDRERSFGQLIVDLRDAGRRPLPHWLARPNRLAETVERLLPLLPPRHYGSCLRRSLVLLDLWTRCGLRPTLHLGFDISTPERRGHAWLTATTADGRLLQVSGPLDTRPAFEL